ncbi:choline transport protein [Mycena olivaceomarginata]|nr:choline transport protein [Mycena olivaceomarginata]
MTETYCILRGKGLGHGEECPKALRERYYRDEWRDNAWVALGGSITVAVANGGAPGIIYEFLAFARLLRMYVVFHPDVLVQPWHIFVAFVLINWICCLTVIFFNGTCRVAEIWTVHDHRGGVWSPLSTGRGGLEGSQFVTGMLNGAFAIGTPDSVTHMAEELPHPRTDLPKAVAAQILLGALTGFVYVVALMFSVTDLDAVLNSNGSFPLAVVYSQATGNKAGTFGLLLIVLLSIMIAIFGGFITAGRIYWALARDNVTPFSSFFSQVSALFSCPVPATLFCAILTTALGAVQLGSKTALADLGGSFIILSTTSYAMAILPHILSGRKNVPQGPFWMGRAGFFVNTMSVLLIVFTNVIFCLPYALPATVPAMNYNSVILIGCVALTTFWWIIHGRTQYPGPRLPHLDAAGHKVDDEI